MRKRMIVVMAALAAAAGALAGREALGGNQDQAPGAGELTTIREKASYCYGVYYARLLKVQLASRKVEQGPFLAGFRDVMSGRPSAFDRRQTTSILTIYQRERAVMLARESKEFLAANKEKEGVVQLPSGLQYRMIEPGEGRPPGERDVVKVYYRGTFVDGTEFDSRLRPADPSAKLVGRTIRGWSEALQLMKPGAKWQLFIPPELAYGEEGNDVVGPNMALIFDVELVSKK